MNSINAAVLRVLAKSRAAQPCMSVEAIAAHLDDGVGRITIQNSLGELVRSGRVEATCDDKNSGKRLYSLTRSQPEDDNPDRMAELTGTIPDRALASLRRHGPGTTSQIAGSINAKLSSVSQALLLLRRRGVIQSRKADTGRGLIWSLPEAAPSSEKAAKPVAAPPSPPAGAPASKPARKALEVEVTEGSHAPPPELADVPRFVGVQKPSCQAGVLRPARFAYRSDRRLQIERDNEIVLLTDFETEQLLDFVEPWIRGRAAS